MPCSDFSAIVSASQRSEYKAVYNESYAKYRQLHQTLDTVTKRAASLQDELKRVSKGSPESKVRLHVPSVRGSG
jgi:hypothetical protein